MKNTTIKLIIVISIGIAIWTFFSNAGIEPAQAQTSVRSCHPRIWISDECEGDPGNLPALRESFFSGDKQVKYASLKSFVDYYIDEVDTLKFDASWHMWGTAHAYSLVYQIEKDTNLNIQKIGNPRRNNKTPP